MFQKPGIGGCRRPANLKTRTTTSMIIIIIIISGSSSSSVVSFSLSISAKTVYVPTI